MNEKELLNEYTQLCITFKAFLDKSPEIDNKFNRETYDIMEGMLKLCMDQQRQLEEIHEAWKKQCNA